MPASPLLRSLTVLVLVLPARTFADGPLDSLLPGEWYEVPDSQMRSVDPCPTRDCVYSGASGQQDVIAAWSGGAFDTKRNRLVIWGGGHSGYAGNEIYVFDVDTLAWQRLSDPSTTLSNDDPYPDGRANPRHTYGTPVYIPTIDRFWVQGGSIWQIGGCGNKTWMYDFDATPPEDGWEQQVSEIASPFTGQLVGTGDCGGMAAYDPVGDQVIVLAHLGYDGAMLFSFDPQNLSAPWTILNSETTRELYQMAAVDPVRRLFVVVGVGKTWAYAFDQPGAPRTTLATTGDTEIEAVDEIYTKAPGVTYDPVSDRIVAWGGGGAVYTLDLDTLVWTKHAPTNAVDPGQPTASGGTFGRFQYVPSKNVFILVNSTKTNVFFYKLTPGDGSLIFSDTFESSDTSAWTDTRP